jgi:hypothetical protein
MVTGAMSRGADAGGSVAKTGSGKTWQNDETGGFFSRHFAAQRLANFAPANNGAHPSNERFKQQESRSHEEIEYIL